MDAELHPLKYGSYFDDKGKLFEVIKAEEEFILKSPGAHNRRIWADLYETALDDEVVGFLAAHLEAIRPKIAKLCLVGCSARDERRIKAKMKRENPDLYNETRYFSDPEEAKQWLAGKLN